MATEFDKKLVNGAVLMDVAKGILERAEGKDAALKTELEGKITGVQGSVTDLGQELDNAVESLQQEDTKLQTAINDEKTRAERKEGELATAISTEETRAKAAEKGLDDKIIAIQGSIGELVGDSISDRLAVLTTRLGDAETDIDDLQNDMTKAQEDIVSLGSRLDTVEPKVATLETGLANEISRAKAAEKGLDEKIVAEQERAQGKEGELASAITALQNKDTTLETAIGKAQTAADNAQADVTALEGVVAQQKTDLNNAIAQEASKREEEDGKLSQAITQEATDRANAITGVRNDMATMKTDLEGAIEEAIGEVNGDASALKERVDVIQPIVNKLNGDANVEGSVANALKVAKAYTDAREAVIKKYADDAVLVEQQRAIAKEEELAGSIGTLRLSLDDTDSALAEEVQRAEGEEAKIRQEMATAIGEKAAEGKEATGLRKEIADAVAAEKQRAERKEGELATAITTAQAAAEQYADEAVAEESKLRVAEEQRIESAYKAADTSLGQRIDGVVGRLDVIEGDSTGSIKKAQADAEKHADDAVKALKDTEVAQNAAVIAKLDGAVDVEGSVKKQIKDAIDAVNSDTNALTGRVKANEDKLAIVMGADTVAGSIAKAQKDAQAYADQQITALVDSAPDAMNTLKELANAISNNKSTYDAYVSQHAEAMAAMKKELQDEIDADVKAEADRAKGEEAAIRGEFAAADTALHKTISAEIDADVKVEKERAEGQEALIRQEMADESARVNKKIADDIKAESDLRKAAEEALAGRLNKLEGDGQGSVKAAVQEVADELAKQKDPAQEGTLAHQIAAEKTRAQNAEKANADGLVDLRSDVVATFKALKLDFTTTPGHAQIVLKQDGSMGENLMPIGDAVEIPVMTSGDVTALLGELDKVQE